MSEEVPFVTGCPITSCRRYKNKYDPCYWKHSKCGSSETINDEGMIKCKKCGNLGLFIELEYQCRLHDDYYTPSTIQEYSAMLSILSDLTTANRYMMKKLTKLVADRC